MKRYYIAPEEIPHTKRQYNDEVEFILYTDHLAARAQDRERIEALEWLVEVQDFYMHRLRNPGGWAPVGCDRALMPKFWARRSNSNDELRDSYKAARAAAGV